MSGNLEAVFSQVVVACSFAALAAIAMREATADRTLHLCARVLGLSAWTALLALSYFTVCEYEKLERALIVRQSNKAGVSDDGRERTIERIDDGTGITIEREHIAGWSLVSATGRGHKTNRSVLRGVAGDSGGNASTEGGNRKGKGCICGLLAVPGCCTGGCSDCQCNQLEIAGNSRQF